MAYGSNAYGSAAYGGLVGDTVAIVVIATPDGRTIKIGIEIRDILILAESRQTIISEEDRIILILQET